MGMYDNIKFKIDCPECGCKIDNFQSKDGPCQLHTLNYWDVDNFYAICKNCSSWVEFNRENPRAVAPISDYEMSTRKH